MKKQLLAAIVAALSAPALFAAAPTMPRETVELDKVIEAEDLETRRYTGQVVSQSVVNIVPRVSGEIVEVGFNDGSFVQKGQVLYRLDPVQYEAAEKNAEATVAERKANFTYAENSYKRNLALFEKNAVSRDAMESSRATMEAGKAALLAAEASLITAKDNLKNTVITAPLKGMAGVTNYTLGNYITPSSGTLLTIIQVRPIRVRFAVSTADIMGMFHSLKELKENAGVKVRLANGEWYEPEGRIELTANEVNRKTDAIQLYASFPNTDFKLLPGSTVGVTLAKKLGRKLPAVRPSAVMHDNGGSYVYVVDAANKVEKRYVKTGNATSALQFITSGLAKGENVIVKGTHKAIPGAVVEASAPTTAEK